MAAVLAGGIGDLCRGTCNAIGQVICFPCRLCGMTCAALGDICSSPFFVYLAVAFGLNTPPIFYTGFASANGGAEDSCRSVMGWMTINAVLCGINMAAAYYITNRIQVERDVETAHHLEDGTYYVESMKSGTTSREKSLSRVKNVLCHDPWVAAYILVGIFYIFWQTVGVRRSAGAGDDCGGAVAGYISKTLLCDFLFMGLGGGAFFCSLCCL